MKNLLTLTLICSLFSFTSSAFAESLEQPNAQVESSQERQKTSTQATNAKFTKININTASADLIAKTLKGVGAKRAEAIIIYRNAHGPFDSIESLAQVKGIGNKTVAMNASKFEI